MSIVTKRGDQGTTVLMYNRQVSKCHPRVEAYGAVDELNAAIGLARAAAEPTRLQENLTALQKDLVLLMGELATTVDDLPRYV
jgi:cob(I)alamin adenosyltransferase